MMMKILLSCVISFLLLRYTTAKNHFGCTVDDLTGKWVFYESRRIVNNAPTINCSVSLPGIYRKVKMAFSPGKVVEDNLAVGTATITDRIGVELNVNHRYYYAPFKTIEYNGQTHIYCDETHLGYSHDYNRRHWSCIYGKKISNRLQKAVVTTHDDRSKLEYEKKNFHEYNTSSSKKVKRKTPNLDKIVGREYFEKIVHEINKDKKSAWIATVYNKFAGWTWRELTRYAGGKNFFPTVSVFSRASSTQTVQRSKHGSYKDLDWRNVNGTNFVSPVRDQSRCGSCFAFATTAMAESRLRIITNNRLKPILSPQDIVNCHHESHGCEGGFPYLVAGGYGWHNGFAEEKCVPYVGIDLPCSERIPCDRHYVTNGFHYVGGYFGGGQEYKIIEALRKNGPVSTTIMVFTDFFTYKRGIYQHKHGLFMGLHSVLIVGYGYDRKLAMRFWTVKNSWSEKWGEHGYFRIRRGTNECGCENSPIETFPIPH